MEKKTGSYGWVVTLCGMGINMTLGSLYAYSIFKSSFEADFGLNAARAAFPYTMQCLVFALSMIPAGRIQDRFGPRVTATAGGIIFGAGYIISGLATSSENAMTYLVPGFGLLIGIGVALSYSSTTPSALKWVPREKHGLIVGLVVGAVGLGAIYVAPLADHMIEAIGVMKTLRILGAAFMATIVICAQFLKNPPEGYVAGENQAAQEPAARDYAWNEVLKTRQFYLVWVIFMFGAGAGLMLISFAKSMAMGAIEGIGFMLVAALAAGNSGGRIIAGAVSDKIGRPRAMFIVFLMQACILGILSRFGAVPAVTIFSVVMIGFNYGACMSLVPSITADYFGLKNLGANYGLIYTAWGAGSIMATIAGKIKVETGSYTSALVLSAVLCVVAAGMTFLVKPPPAKISEQQS
ncbi:OFA family MFS transporter [bacterium]